MELGVAVTVVPTQGEADVICGLLESEGIEAKAREMVADGTPGAFPGWHEIMVRRADVDRARELIEAAEPDR
jgi:hypothetical protein